MTVFAGIIDQTGQQIPTATQSATIAAFKASCQQKISFEQTNENCLLLSFHIHETSDNTIKLNPDSVTIVAGDPIFRRSLGEVSQDIAKLNAAAEQPELIELLAQAKGVFAGIKYDKNSCQISLFTDKSGIRPVYYYQLGNLFIFSSLLSFFENLSFVPLEVEFDNLCEQLGFSYIFGNKTPYKKLKRLDSGECLHTTSDGLTIDKYWDWLKLPIKSNITENDVQEAYQSFDQAIKIRLESDHESIAFLSGGLDSRAICSQVKKHVSNLHTFNFSTQRSQDNEFAKLYAEADHLTHHEKQFDTLSFPNWGQLIADAIKDQHEKLHLSTNRNVVWSGDGGSVAMGHVYVYPDVMDALKRGDRKWAIERYFEKRKVLLPLRYFKKRFADKTVGLLEQSLNSQLTAHADEPCSSMYHYLMNNTVQRHLTAHFETICQHQIEYLLPFVDSDFLEKIYAIPHSEMIHHKFYMRWFKHFPQSSRLTPWQTYPEHEECPLPSPTGLSYQWDNVAQPLKTNKTDFDFYLEVKKSPVFKRFFNPVQVGIAMQLHRFGLKDFSYMVNMLKQINQFKETTNS